MFCESQELLLSPYFYGFLIQVLLLSYLIHLLSEVRIAREEEIEEKNPITISELSGTWQSKIYQNENGFVKICLLQSEGEESPSKAKAILNYSSQSKFKPSCEVILYFDCQYDNKEKHYILKQDTLDGQFFVMHFNKKKGHMICVNPADMCEIDFKPKERSKKDN